MVGFKVFAVNGLNKISEPGFGEILKIKRKLIIQ
jgi:hypothetical protein